MADVYAVVDKSKKKKRNPAPEDEGVSNMALYSVVQKCNMDAEDLPSSEKAPSVSSFPGVSV